MPLSTAATKASCGGGGASLDGIRQRRCAAAAAPQERPRCGGRSTLRTCVMPLSLCLSRPAERMRLPVARMYSVRADIARRLWKRAIADYGRLTSAKAQSGRGKCGGASMVLGGGKALRSSPPLPEGARGRSPGSKGATRRALPLHHCETCDAIVADLCRTAGRPPPTWHARLGLGATASPPAAAIQPIRPCICPGRRLRLGSAPIHPTAQEPAND
jgi:hypothetical protein